MKRFLEMLLVALGIMCIQNIALASSEKNLSTQQQQQSKKTTDADNAPEKIAGGEEGENVFDFEIYNTIENLKNVEQDPTGNMNLLFKDGSTATYKLNKGEYKKQSNKGEEKKQ